MAGCKCCSSYTPAAYIWAVLSIISSILCPIGLYFSNWLQREFPSGYTSFSSFRLCMNQSSQISFSCDSYFTFDEIYTPHWKAVTLLVGAGACCLVFTSLLSLFGFCVTKLFNKCITAVVAIFQSLGVVLFIAGIIVFPSGIGGSSVEAVCGTNSGAFKLGACTVGWAYITIIIGTATAAAAAALSWTPARWKKMDTQRSYAL